MSNIGAGARVYMGTGAVPVLPFTTSQPNQGQIAANGVAGNLTNVNLSTKQGTVDITKLTADLDGYFRKHIAGLLDADGSGKYGDDETGAFERRVDAIQQGKLHPNGRGKVDMIVRPNGDGVGLLQYRFVVSFPSISGNTEVEGEIGGDISYKVDGRLFKELQIA